MPLHLFSAPQKVVPDATAGSLAHAISRRAFLAICAAGCAKSAIPPSASEEEWALLSDTHIHYDPKMTAWDSCMTENLLQVLDEVADLAPDQVLFNGDVAFRAGDPPDYAQFLTILNRSSKPRADLHFTLGNHDHRAHLVAALTPAADSVLESKVASGFVGRNTHFLLLDSLEKVNAIAGSLGRPQRDWLSARLKAHPDLPAVIFLHHNPEVSLSGLTDTPEFLDIVHRHRQVKAVVFGHTHEFRVASSDGVHFINLPAVGYRFKPDEPLGWVQSRFRTGGASFELHCIHGNNPNCGRRHELAWRANRSA
jgi:3',5'-cyclic AMP phosphodiesterase CpdA